MSFGLFERNPTFFILFNTTFLTTLLQCRLNKNIYLEETLKQDLRERLIITKLSSSSPEHQINEPSPGVVTSNLDYYLLLRRQFFKISKLAACAVKNVVWKFI